MTHTGNGAILAVGDFGRLISPHRGVSQYFFGSLWSFEEEFLTGGIVGQFESSPQRAEVLSKRGLTCDHS